jgi:hypothetical protein
MSGGLITLDCNDNELLELLLVNFICCVDVYISIAEDVELLIHTWENISGTDALTAGSGLNILLIKSYHNIITNQHNILNNIIILL